MTGAREESGGGSATDRRACRRVFQPHLFISTRILTDEDSEADPKTQNEVSGTPGYAAPEVFLRTGVLAIGTLSIL